MAFSSKMSNTILNIFEARDELLKKYPERKMIVVDTMSISAPMTLLVLKAHDMYLAGATMEEIEAWVLENRFRAQVWPGRLREGRESAPAGSTAPAAGREDVFEA